jgi:alpha-tubulin suppressor-like RCC1 family protein
MHAQRGVRSCAGRAQRVLPATLVSVFLALALALIPAAQAGAAPFGAAAWGYNSFGQLGDGSTAISRVPVAVSGLTGVTAVSAGREHSLALLSGGTVMAWGNNREGQLGNGSTANSDVPVAVSGLTGVTAISAGGEHSLALLSNGTVMAWGSDEEDQLGSGVKAGTKSAVPVAVKGLSGVTAIAAGGAFSLALLSNGTVMAWGAGAEGQLGNGKKAKSASPVAVKGLSGVSAVAAGREHALALLSDGTVMSWGNNSSLQLGMEAKTKIIKEEEEEFVEEEEEPENSAVPVAVQTLSGATAVAAGAEHSMALLGGGEVVAWGGNSDGQLGRGMQGGMSSHPEPVADLSGVSAIAAGSEHSLALLSGGSVLAWGYNPDGQLGNGGNVNSAVPVAVSGLGGVAGIAGGGAHSLSFGVPPASVTGVSPGSGAQQGGTSVTITGAGLSEVTAVQFGANAAAAFTPESPTQLTATSPPGDGVVDVTVTTPTGTSAATAADRFTYVPPPAIKRLKPSKGPAAGGTTVTITGTALTGATAVAFGATSATSFTVQSATSITAVAPPGTAGPANVAVTTPSGTSAPSTHGVFKYGSPTIASVSPGSGPREGGTSVIVSGTGFAPGAGATAFTFGKATASSVSCESATSCVLVTPAAKAGTVDVVASVGKAKSKKTRPQDQFTFE